MASVTGTLTDFGLEPLEGFAPKLIFRPSTPGLSGMAVLATKAVEVFPAANGFFQVDLTPTAEVSPPMHYTIQLRWVEKYPGRKERIETLPWKLEVPTGGGFLSDLLRVPSNPALAWSGEEPPANPTPGSWWLKPSTGDLAEYNGTGWASKANLRGPAGYNATDAAADDNAVAAFVKSLVGTTATRAALNERFARKGEDGSLVHIPPMHNIQKAKTGPFRALLTGTSISSFDQSSPRVLMQHLRGLYGSTGQTGQLLGILGGAYANTVNGWKKQVYGGPLFHRLVSTATSTALTFILTGNELVLWWSKEADSAPVEILCDGVSVGTAGAPGAQAYAQRAVFALPEGSHIITINPPAAGTGNAYLEQIDCHDTGRTGVEWVDGTLGGSGIWNATTNRPTQAGQLAPIPIVGDNGLAAHFKRTDIDLFIVEHIFNDAGVEANNGVFEHNIGYAVEETRKRGVPLVLIIEPGGGQVDVAGYIARRTYLQSLATIPHVTVIDWHAAIWPGNKADLLAMYYPANDTSHPLQNAYDVLNGILARVFNVPNFPLRKASEYPDARMRDMSDFYKGAARNATVAGVAKSYAVPEAPALRAIHAGAAGTDRMPGKKAWAYRDTTAVNRASAMNADIAATGTVDAYGKYKDYVNYNHYVNYFTAADTEVYTFTVKVAGVFSCMGNSPVYMLDDKGRKVPYNEQVPLRHNMRHVVVGAEPIVLTFQMAVSATNPVNIQISGRIYELSIVKANASVLV